MDNNTQPPALNPLSIIVPVVILGLVIVVLAGRKNTSAVEKAGATAGQAARKGRSSTRRAALTLAISALENDALRRVVIMGLKIARNRV